MPEPARPLGTDDADDLRLYLEAAAREPLLTKEEEVELAMLIERVGDTIEVAGTAASAEDGTILAPGDPEGQARAILATIGGALRELGADYSDVVRTRVYLRNVDDWEAVARAHSEVFGDVRPANTTVAAQLVDPDMLVEIEVTAIVDDDA